MIPKAATIMVFNLIFCRFSSLIVAIR
jgi:hypothetical protein